MARATSGTSTPDPNGRSIVVLIEVMPLIVAWLGIFASGFLLPILHHEPATLTGAASLGSHLANRQIVAVLASAAIAVFTHEGGHLLAAVVFRAVLRNVVVGVGPRVWQRGRLTVRLIPLAGHVRFGSRSHGYPVILIVGPAINAILAAVMWRVTTAGTLAEFRWALIGPQLWYLLLTGVPARPLYSGADVNDATAILRWSRARTTKGQRRP